MRLRKIEVVGFKSFADREVVVVDDRVTAVIGPNGCGKSNIVDAIRWCMGEQSAKHLRGAGMSDVIFAGCDARGPAGMAEVTLTFENEGDLQPPYAGYPEVGISRRLFQDGTSEYLINKVPARLRDITDLLLGTGAGTKGYAIIEQGQVGRIVSSKPEERRHILDEAAGITRFKAQKAAAERKIAATRQNLLRVQDVITELEARLGSLRRQAQKAERYRRYRNELRDLDLWMATHKKLELDSTGRVLAERREDLGQQVDALRTELVTRETHIQGKRLELTELETELGERQQEVFDLDNRIQLLEAENQFREREREDLGERVAQARAEADVVGRGIHGLESELVECGGEVEKLGDADTPGSTGAEVVRLETCHADVLVGLDREANAELSAGAERGEVQTRLAAAGERLEARTEAIVGIEERVAQLEAEATELAAAKAVETTELDRMGKALEAAKTALTNLRTGRDQLDRERSSLREQLAGAEVELDTTRAELHRCRSRLQSLEEIQSRYRGCTSGVQVIMEHRDDLYSQQQLGAGGSERVVGIMADYISTPEHLEPAVSAMLGDRLQGVVVEETTEAARGVALLKQLKEGRTTFLPRACASVTDAAGKVGWSPARPGRDAGIEVVDLSDGAPAPTKPLDGRPGVLGRLVDMVEVDARMRPLAQLLLGDAVVVDGLSRALELWKSDGRGSTLVTLDGDRIEPSGVIVGGAPDALDSALLQQKREIRELEEISRELDETFSAARGRQLALAERMRDVEAQREQSESDVLAAEKQRLEHAQSVEQGQQTIARIEAQTATIDRARLGFEGQLAERRDEVAELEQRRADDHARLEQLESVLARARDRVAELGRDRDRTAAELTDAKVAHARWQQQWDTLDATRQRLLDQLSSERSRAERLRQTSVDGEARVAELTKAADEATREHDELVSRSREVTERVRQARETFDNLRIEVDEVEASVRNLRGELDEQRDRLKDVEMGVQEIDLERQHLHEGIRERFDLRLEDVLVDFHHRPVAGKTEQERQRELKRIISRMGEVNLTAIEEFDEVSQRYDYLTGQRGDLEDAIGQLQSAIDRINRTTRQRFKDTFEAVNEQFKQVFPRLFNGGRAELIMTDPSDLLGTGVEIVAQPPGKQLRSLDLLSGGEKALTAVSLIFAVFLIKPSPFCLLDEVDAPLDDANVGRFNGLVSELATRTQFIIITHNKITMENADRLYGVTMEQRGVSKLVSVNMRRAVEIAYN